MPQTSADWEGKVRLFTTNTHYDSPTASVCDSTSAEVISCYLPLLTCLFGFVPSCTASLPHFASLDSLSVSLANHNLLAPHAEHQSAFSGLRTKTPVFFLVTNIKVLFILVYRAKSSWV